MSTYPTMLQQPDQLGAALKPSALSPLHWLRAGLQDMMAAPFATVTLGAAFTALCVLAGSAVSTMPMFAAAVLVLLLLASPFIAAAAYHVPLRREHGDRPTVSACIDGVRKHFLSIGLFSVVCALIVAAWTRLSGIAFALYYGSFASGPEVARIWTSGQQPVSMIMFLAVSSLLLASVLFAISAISLPRIAERNANVVSAVGASLRTLRDNKLTVGVWAVLISALVGAALISNLVLMPFVFPLLAYATWHSYRQLSRDNT